jgi:hypothetical protein
LRHTLLALALLVSFVAAPAHANSITTTFILNMTGNQEVPGPGDPDGSATGTITFHETNGLIEWNITYADIAAPTGMHIHPGAAGQAGGVFVGLGVATSGGAGTLIGSVTTSVANVATILADPTAFYVNIHNGDFGAGAVRGQLGVVPEPASAGLLAFGLAWLARRGGASRPRA